jgi:phosphoribosylaminoimidazole-succinocarboxamide synthase
MAEDLLYEGKAKKVFTTHDERVLLHRYKDEATAFNAQKRGSWKNKGKTNATMSAAIFAYLETRQHHQDQKARHAAGRDRSSQRRRRLS